VQKLPDGSRVRTVVALADIRWMGTSMCTISRALRVAAILAAAVLVPPGAAGSQEKVGQGAWANYDFVPGERVLFADDFAADRVGNFPRRLEMLVGNMEVVEWKGRRFLRATSPSAFAITLPEVLPQRFTLEMDVTVPWWGMSIYGGPDGRANPSESSPRRDLSHAFVYLSGTEAGLLRAGGEAAAIVDPQSVLAAELGDSSIGGHLVRLRVHADGQYVKVYLDEHRIANVPNADFLRTRKIVVETTGFPPAGEGNIPTLIGNITVNAGGRRMYDALMADGRVATQGIYFDTGSDRLRPESTPTLNEIAAMLREHPDLKLRIEGHTDAVGNAAANQTLSERRAAAVKAYLVGTGCGAARLESAGLGAARPVASNDTPEGRQNNRRVELVKL
jgi:OmpA-OmpF porin, OOP family